MSDPLSTLHSILLSGIIVLAVGALCFIIPMSSHRMLRPRRKKLLDDDWASMAEAGHAVGADTLQQMALEKDSAAVRKQEATLGQDLQEDLVDRNTSGLDAQYPERLLMLRVRIARFDEEFDGKEGIPVAYDKMNRRYTVVMMNGDVARIGVDQLEAVHSMEILTVKVVSATGVRMREEAQARVQSRLNVYMVLTLGERHMRTRILLDNNNARFDEYFHCILDRTSEQSQLLSLQVFHHNSNAGQDVRLGICFFSVRGMRAGEKKSLTKALGTSHHPAGTIHVELSVERKLESQRMFYDLRSFKLQGLEAWPATAGYVGLANSLVMEPRWMTILSKLQPRLANMVKAEVGHSPQRVMMLLQSSPVLAAYGYINTGGTNVLPPPGHSVARAILQMRPIEIDIQFDRDQANRVDLCKVDGGTRAQTLFQAAFQRSISADAHVLKHLRVSKLKLDDWLQIFANAIALALNQSVYSSLRDFVIRERHRLIQEEAAMEEERRRLARLREMEQDTMVDKVGAAFQLIGSELGAVTSGLTCGLASDGVEVLTKAADEVADKQIAHISSSVSHIKRVFRSSVSPMKMKNSCFKSKQRFAPSSPPAGAGQIHALSTDEAKQSDEDPPPFASEQSSSTKVPGAQVSDPMRRACISLKLASKGDSITADHFKAKKLPPTWHTLVEMPSQEDFLRTMIGDEENKAAMELVGDLLSRTASETLAEITSSVVRMQITGNQCSSIDGWLHLTITNTQVHDTSRKSSEAKKLDDIAERRDELTSLLSSLRMMGIAVGAVCASDEKALVLDREQLPLFQMYSELRALEDAVRQPNLHQDLKRDRLALINIGALVEDLSHGDPKSGGRNSRRSSRSSRGSRSSRNSNSSSSPRRSSRFGTKHASLHPSYFEEATSLLSGDEESSIDQRSTSKDDHELRDYTHAVLDPQKMAKLRLLAEAGRLILGIYVADFPPPPRLVELAEELALSGYYDSASGQWLHGPALLPLGTAHRLPRLHALAEDADLDGRGLPPSFVPDPKVVAQLSEYASRLKDLTVDIARKAFKAGDHLRLPREAVIPTLSLWIRRLLFGLCPPKDQRMAIRLFTWNNDLISWTIWAYGLKFIFMRFAGNESIRLIRLFRDVGYLMRMSLEDRQRFLFFILRQRITPATQEFAACIFEACTPRQAEHVLQVFDVRLLRFSVGGTYWRRVIASLSNPYVTAAAVYGINLCPLTSNRNALERALDAELLIRGPLASRNIRALRGRELPNELPYDQLATTLHTGDLLMLWERDPLISREVAPLCAVVVRLEDLTSSSTSYSSPVCFVIWAEPRNLQRGVRQICIRTLLALTRIAHNSHVTLRRLLGSELDHREQPGLVRPTAKSDVNPEHSTQAMRKMQHAGNLASLGITRRERSCIVQQPSTESALAPSSALPPSLGPKKPSMPGRSVSFVDDVDGTGISPSTSARRLMGAILPSAPAPEALRTCVQPDQDPFPAPRNTRGLPTPPPSPPGEHAAAHEVPLDEVTAEAAAAVREGDGTLSGGIGLDVGAAAMAATDVALAADRTDPRNLFSSAAPATEPSMSASSSTGSAPAPEEVVSPRSSKRKGKEKAPMNEPEPPVGVSLDIPHFVCPISHEIMQDPVFTADGQTYERQKIMEWLEHNDTSPLTGRILEHKFVVPNYAMRGMIGELLSKYPELAGAPIPEHPTNMSDSEDEDEDLYYSSGEATMHDAVKPETKLISTPAMVVTSSAGPLLPLSKSAGTHSLASNGTSASRSSAAAPGPSNIFAGSTSSAPAPGSSGPSAGPSSAPAPGPSYTSAGPSSAPAPGPSNTSAGPSSAPAPGPSGSAAGPSAAPVSGTSFNSPAPAPATTHIDKRLTAIEAFALADLVADLVPEPNVPEHDIPSATLPPATVGAIAALAVQGFDTNLVAVEIARRAKKAVDEHAADSDYSHANLKDSKHAPIAVLRAAFAGIPMSAIPPLVTEFGVVSGAKGKKESDVSDTEEEPVKSVLPDEQKIDHRSMVTALQDFVSDEVLLDMDELRHILGEKYTEPTLAKPQLTDGDSAKVLSGLMPVALFERIGLVSDGDSWGMTANDFDEGGRIETMLPGSVWLGPQQRVILPEAQKETVPRNSLDLEPIKLIKTLRKSVPGQSVLSMMEEDGGILIPEMDAPPPPISKRTQTVRELLPYVQTGDLVMMRSETFPGRFLQQATGCDFCHVSIILRIPELPHSPLLLEADPQVSHIVGRSAASCLHVVDLRSRVSSWLSASASHQAVLRRLRRPADAPNLDASGLLGLAATQSRQLAGNVMNGQSVERSQTRALLEALYGPKFVQSIATLTSDEGVAPLHAAEAVALAYKALRILDSSAPKPEAYTVRDFTEAPPLIEGYSLLPRISIVSGHDIDVVAHKLSAKLGIQPQRSAVQKV